MTLNIGYSAPGLGKGSKSRTSKKIIFFFAFIFLIFKEQVLFRFDFLRVTSVSRFFFAFLSFAESFVVEHQTLFGVDLIHISI